MKSDHINAFVVGGFRVLESLLGATPKRGEITALPTVFTSEQCNVTVGVTGDVHGIVIFGMSMITADRIASQMIGSTIKTFDQLAASAIAEMCNMICGHALTSLSDSGVKCDITPPALIRGSNTKVSTLSIPAIVVPLVLTVGTLNVTISLSDKYPAPTR